MHNKIYPALLALLLLTASCRKAMEIKPVATSSDILANCATFSCPDINIVYLSAHGNQEASAKINAEITDFIIQSLYVGENISDATTIRKAMADFIQLYRTHSAEFPGLSAEYFAEITVLQNFNGKNIFSTSCRNYVYTGGAHGYGSVAYKNFDPKTGNLLRYKDLFKDFEAFKTIAESTFRKQNDIPENETINAKEFWFEDDTFYLPETFGISKKFVTLHYNQYDIAPYAAGPIVLEIPISEVKDLLKIEIE